MLSDNEYWDIFMPYMGLKIILRMISKSNKINIAFIVR